MNKLRINNESIYEEYKSIDDIENISSPLLVSSKRYLESIKKNPIMYIGQETNEWVNYDNNSIHSLNDIENRYDEFLIDYKTAKTIYWQFIKNILTTEYDDIHKNIIWTNTLICGNRFSKGHPEITKELENLSLQNLLFLYDYFKPSYIINVSGSNNPYYNITEKFLNEIGISIEYPISTNAITIKDNYIWTYHPNYLRKSKKEKEVKEKIKRLIK